MFGSYFLHFDWVFDNKKSEKNKRELCLIHRDYSQQQKVLLH